MVSRQCTRLENLLNDFLRFNKVNQLELTLGSLNEQLERVLDLFAAQAEESHVEIVRYLDPDLPSIQLNAETLQAALVNLVKNALEAMPDGGQLTARSRVTRQGVALDLIDTGMGMDERTAMKMFDAFYTTRAAAVAWGCPPRAGSSKPTAAASAFTAKWASARNSRSNSRRRGGLGTEDNATTTSDPHEPPALATSTNHSSQILAQNSPAFGVELPAVGDVEADAVHIDQDRAVGLRRRMSSSRKRN